MGRRGCPAGFHESATEAPATLAPYDVPPHPSDYLRTRPALEGHHIDLGLQHRSVVVTGGSSGIGRAIVTTLLAEGACVTTCGLQQDKLVTLEADLNVPDRLLTQVCDVRDATALQRLAQTAADRFGGIDGVVCNAGRGHVGGVLDATDDAWRDDYEVKVLAMLHTVRACLPALHRSDQPRVVVIGGVTASRPHPAMAAVSASRAALLNVCLLLAAELAPSGVLVNSVSVGVVDTDRVRERWSAAGSPPYPKWSATEAAQRGIALGRLAAPHEVADVVVFLLSRPASYLTGSVVEVTGGYGLPRPEGQGTARSRPEGSAG